VCQLQNCGFAKIFSVFARKAKIQVRVKCARIAEMLNVFAGNFCVACRVCIQLARMACERLECSTTVAACLPVENSLQGKLGALVGILAMRVDGGIEPV
jgi:hypothetical protein